MDQTTAAGQPDRDDTPVLPAYRHPDGVTETQNRLEAGAIEADAVAAALRAIVAERGVWSGTATALLAEIARRTPPARQAVLPKDATRLSVRLQEAASDLLQAGVEVAHRRRGVARTVTVRAAVAVEAVPPAPEPPPPATPWPSRSGLRASRSPRRRWR